MIRYCAIAPLIFGYEKTSASKYSQSETVAASREVRQEIEDTLFIIADG